jgi:hypothetical protein
MHSHEADSEACLNRKIFNIALKRKAMDDLKERPRKLVHKELQSRYFDTLTYKDIRNISRNMHKARFFQLLLLATDIEETHEALTAMQVLTSSKEQFLLVNDSEKKYCNVLFCEVKECHFHLVQSWCRKIQCLVTQ